MLASRDVIGPSASLAPPPVDSPLPSPFRGTPPGAAPLVVTGSASASCWCAPSLSEQKKKKRRAAQRRRVPIRAHGAAEIEVATPTYGLPARRPSWRSSATSSMPLPIPPSRAGPRSNACSATSSSIGRARHATTIPFLRAMAWRCTVPVCSSRRNLHDHHLRFRSRGGDNARDNRTTVCAAHHLHGIHDGTIHASCTAPHGDRIRARRPSGASSVPRIRG